MVTHMNPYPPDPFGESDADIKVFDPSRPRFRGVPLVQFTATGVNVLRGALPGYVSLDQIIDAGANIDAIPGEVFGVLANTLGDLVLAEEGCDFGYDVRFEREIVIDFYLPITSFPKDIQAALADIGLELARAHTRSWRVPSTLAGRSSTSSPNRPPASPAMTPPTSAANPRNDGAPDGLTDQRGNDDEFLSPHSVG